MAWFNKNQRKAVVNYIDLDQDLSSIETSEELKGKVGEEIEYDPKSKIKDLEGKGYVLVKNQFNSKGKNPTFKDSKDTQVYLISFKHGERKVNPDHPLTKLGVEKYEQPITFTIKFEGTPTHVKDHVQTIKRYRTLTADKITGEQIPNGQFDTDWKLEADKFDDFDLPVFPGAHTNKKMIAGPEVGEKNITVTVNYEPNGHLIPVDEDGNEIQDVGPYQFASDEDDPTRVAANQIVPEIDGYTHDQETISPQDPAKDMPVIYKHIKVEEEAPAPLLGGSHNSEQDELTEVPHTEAPAMPDELPEDDIVANAADNAAKEEISRQAAKVMGMDDQVNEHGEARAEDEQMAIVNFIDLDNDGRQITSSGPLYGLPGDSINDLYNTAEPLKAIEEAGFDVVFNNFDGSGQEQHFNNNHLITQVFTIGLVHRPADGSSVAEPEKLDKQRQEISNKIDVLSKDKDNSESEAVMSIANAALKLLNTLTEEKREQEKASQDKTANNDPKAKADHK